MKVRIKSIEEIKKYKLAGRYPNPSFIEERIFKHGGFPRHSMEYYCGKIIDLDENNNFDGWIWRDWMFEKDTKNDLDIE